MLPDRSTCISVFVKENFMTKRLILSGTIFFSGFLALLLMPATIPGSKAQRANPQSGGQVSTTKLTPAGTTKLGGKVVISGEALGNETRSGPEQDMQFDKQISGSISPARVPAAQIPR